MAIKDILPRGWIPTLMKATNLSKSSVYKIVNTEDISHPIWPIVLEMAEKNQKRLAPLRKKTNKIREKIDQK